MANTAETKQRLNNIAEAAKDAMERGRKDPKYSFNEASKAMVQEAFDLGVLAERNIGQPNANIKIVDPKVVQPVVAQTPAQEPVETPAPTTPVQAEEPAQTPPQDGNDPLAQNP